MKLLALTLTCLFFFSNAQAVTIQLQDKPVLGVKGLDKKRQEEMGELLKRIAAAANEQHKFFGFYPDSFEDLGLSQEFVQALNGYKFDYYSEEDGFVAEIQFGDHTITVAEGDTITVKR